MFKNCEEYPTPPHWRSCLTPTGEMAVCDNDTHYHIIMWDDETPLEPVRIPKHPNMTLRDIYDEYLIEIAETKQIDDE